MKQMEGGLAVYPPYEDGVEEQFGYSRVWRFDPRTHVPWDGERMEWIEPLKAIAPRGDARPRTNTLDTFGAVDWYSSQNASFRVVKSCGNPAVDWIEFDDSRMYESEEAGSAVGMLTSGVWSTGCLPNFLLSAYRYMPPAGQGVSCSTVLSFPALRRVDGQWTEEGRVSLYLPLADEQYGAPILHYISDDDAEELQGVWNIFVHGVLLSSGPSQCSTVQRAHELRILFEYVEDPARFDGGYLLIRFLENPENWWVFHDEDLRLTTGYWWVQCTGARQILNVSPVRYGDKPEGADEEDANAWARPVRALPLPNMPGNEWNREVTWRYIATEAAGWTVTVERCDFDSGLYYRPQVEMTRTGVTAWQRRPVVWVVSEEHPAVIGGEGLGIAASTVGDRKLSRISYTFGDDWRGARGSATFARENAETYSTWEVGAKTEISMGWESTESAALRSQKLATCYLEPGGLVRGRDGTQQFGIPGLTAQFGDYTVAHLDQKDIMDVMQAGGLTVGVWFRACGNRIGFPETMIDVAAAVENIPIPLGDLPSEPAFEPRDGEKWPAHLDSVCNDLNLRWGVDKDSDGKLFVDAGPPAYEPGVSEIALEIDNDTTDLTEVLLGIDRTESGQGFRNLLKIIVGTPPRVHYYAHSYEVRRAFGSTWSAVLTDPDAKSAIVLAQRAYKYFAEHADVLRIVTMLRPGLRPDQFVKLVDMPYLGGTTDAVYQVKGGEHTEDHEANKGETIFTAARVYPVP